MKPVKILLFLFAIFIILFIMSAIFPRDGIKLSNSIKLNFPAPRDILKKDSVTYTDISQILTQNELFTDSLLFALADNDAELSDLTMQDTIRANADSLLQSLSRIEYPTGNDTVLYPVFRALKNTKDTNGLIRIMHYGDSQIEGDRMTSLLRNRLQKKFGGNGIGLVPASQLYNYSFSMRQKSSENWYRYTIYGTIDTLLMHNRYGSLAGFCTFTPQSTDTIYTDTATYKAWVSFEKSNSSYPNTKLFQQCKVFYGNNQEPFIHEVYINNELYDADIIYQTQGLNTLTWEFEEPQDNITLQFSGKSSPEIYGIALDPLHGVAVDNIPMRGCAGTIFTKIDVELLKEMYHLLNVKLFILQFGGNVVPHITNDYGYYERAFYRQLKRLKEVCPDASIVVIGVADMSLKEKNKYVTYPNLEKVRDALKSATFRAGAAYWDMYKAMGGKNSMPSWVFAQPSLAVKDFVHFNPRGARIIAQMFYNAFIYEYNRYEKKIILNEPTNLQVFLKQE